VYDAVEPLREEIRNMPQNAPGRMGKVFSLFEEYILFLMTLQMGLSIFLQVVMRYVFNSAITWLDELVHIEVIFLTFFGASLGIKYGSHIAVDALKRLIRKEPYQSLVEAFAHLVTAAYIGIIIYFGMTLYAAMAKFTHFTPALRIPKHYLYLIVCIGLALIGIRSLIRFCRTVIRSCRTVASLGQSEP
jgi:C4-dicarboxylate transporter DctQ subunit